MQLDYNETADLFFLKVPRIEADPRMLMKEYGLAFSTPASTPDVACLFTAEPYAAACFNHCATPKAQAALAWICEVSTRQGLKLVRVILRSLPKGSCGRSSVRQWITALNAPMR